MKEIVSEINERLKREYIEAVKRKRPYVNDKGKLEWK